MMLIQIILICGFALLFLKFVASPNSYQVKAWKKIIGLLFLVLAVVAILLPDRLNSIAHFFGVGRGADLLLYLLTLAFIFVVFAQYVAGRQEQRRMAQLARKVALLEAEIHKGQ
jgi:hypothetical protein